MKRRSQPTTTPAVRCAVYTRKSTEEGLEQEFNSLDAQRESGQSFIASQRHEGWQCLPDRYDDGGFTGGNMDRPALKRLLADIEAGKIDCVVVYKVDRLSRSLLDFARMMEVFEQHKVSFVSVTQQFNTASSMGRLVLNVLLSFAQFEREMISERVRDKIAASRRKGKWSGGMPLMGYTVKETKLVVDEVEAQRVRQIFELYLEYQSLLPTVTELNRRGWTTKHWTTRNGTQRGGRLFTKNGLYALLTNVTYIGQIRYKDEVHRGEHQPIVPDELFRKAQALLQRNGHTGGRAVRNKHGALLRGLLRCGPCGCAMSHTFTAKGNRRYRYYVCGTAQQRGWTECPSPSVAAGEIERFVVEQIKCIGRDPAVVAETVRQVREQTVATIERLDHDRDGLKQQLRDDNARLQTATALSDQLERMSRLADTQEHIRIAERRLTEIDNELISLEGKLVDEAEVARALADFDMMWETLGRNQPSSSARSPTRTRATLANGRRCKPLRGLRILRVSKTPLWGPRELTAVSLRVRERKPGTPEPTLFVTILCSAPRHNTIYRHKLEVSSLFRQCPCDINSSRNPSRHAVRRGTKNLRSLFEGNCYDCWWVGFS